MLKRCLLLSLIVVLLALSGSTSAQDAGGAKNQRAFYQVKHGTAGALADLLAKHFKGEAGFQAIAESTNNALLLSAPPPILKEALQVLEQLDRQPKVIALEVLVAQLAIKQGEKAKQLPVDDLDSKDFTGTIAAVVGKLEGLRAQGTIAELKRIQLTALEHRPASVIIGENKPYTTGINVSIAADGTPRAMRSIAYRSVGTTVAVTAQVAEGKLIALDLQFEDSRTVTPEDGISIGKDEDGKPVRVAEFVVASLKARVNLPSGSAAAVEGVGLNTRTGQTRTLVVVTARILD